MSKNKVLIASIFIIIGGIYRLFPHPSNVSPVAAMALLGGLYLGRNYLAFLVPIAALFASDLILNNTINRGFFPDQTGIILGAKYMIYTYGAYLLTVAFGFLLHHKSAVHKIVAGTLISSILFFLVTNAGTWASGLIYPKTFAGLMASFTAGVPFFRNTLISNAIFITLFVTATEIITRTKAMSKQTA